jgi:hypothetical protein
MRKAVPLYAAAGLFLFVSTLAGKANAAVVFQQLPDFELPGASSQGQWVSSTKGVAGTVPGYRSADNFHLSSAATISQIQWWGSPLVGGDSFTFTFYADSSGVPGTIISTANAGSIATSPISGLSQATDLYSTSLSAPFNAAANTPYWISIFDAGSTADWQWEQSAHGSAFQIQNVVNSTWTQTGSDFAFSLVSVPEPESLAFVALGTCAALCRPKRRR